MWVSHPECAWSSDLLILRMGTGYRGQLSDSFVNSGKETGEADLKQGTTAVAFSHWANPTSNLTYPISYSVRIRVAPKCSRDESENKLIETRNHNSQVSEMSLFECFVHDLHITIVVWLKTIQLNISVLWTYLSYLQLSYNNQVKAFRNRIFCCKRNAHIFHYIRRNSKRLIWHALISRDFHFGVN